MSEAVIGGVFYGFIVGLMAGAGVVSYYGIKRANRALVSTLETVSPDQIRVIQEVCKRAKQ